MTEREARIRRAVAMCADAFPSSGGGDWPKRRLEVWVDAVVDQEPDAVEKGAAQLVREWEEMRPPRPADLRNRVLSHRKGAGAVAELEGCPVGRKLGVDCRYEQAPALTWVSDEGAGLTTCMVHNVSWRGVLPRPPEEPLFTAKEALERGYINPDGVLARAIKRKAAGEAVPTGDLAPVSHFLGGVWPPRGEGA